MILLRLVPILTALALLIAAPLCLREPQSAPGAGADALVIISPHNEAIRFEFSRAFEEFYREKTGRNVHIDWRLPGGTTEIVRYLNAEFEAGFRSYWTQKLRVPWSRTVLEGFSNPRLSERENKDSPAEYARKAFLSSDVGCGIDLFFGVEVLISLTLLIADFSWTAAFLIEIQRYFRPAAIPGFLKRWEVSPTGMLRDVG
jgi:hypothetical protein